jgi:hypothetical protein
MIEQGNFNKSVHPNRRRSKWIGAGAARRRYYNLNLQQFHFDVEPC